MAKNVNTDVSTAKITVAQYHPFERKSDLKINAGALTTRNDRELLQSIAKQRDEMNRGMTRKDMIVLISELHSTDQKTAENHFDYLIRAKALPDLKKGGRVVTAQATTTNRTAITTKKLLRTYNTTLEAWRIQSERNGWDVRDEGACDKKEFDRLRDGLTWNLDETCFRAEDGVLKIIGSNERKKHEKNTSDSRLSITVVRIGSAAGIEGPRIYLGKGKEDPPSHMKKGNFSSRYTAPPGSYVKMTPNAYMTNIVWDELAADISEGIRACPGVRENPELWVVLSIDGFGSHLQGCALQVFHT